MFKRILALVLAVVFLVGIVPVFAEEDIYKPKFTTDKISVNFSYFDGIEISLDAVPGLFTKKTLAYEVLNMIVSQNGETFTILSYINEQWTPLDEQEYIGGNIYIQVNFPDETKKYYPLTINDTPESREVILTVGMSRMIVDDYYMDVDPGRGTAPIIKDGRTLVPVASFVDVFGGTVEWVAEDKSINIALGEKHVTFTLNSRLALVNRMMAVDLDVAPVSIDGRTFVPVGLMGQYLGLNVAWNAERKEITLTNK